MNVKIIKWFGGWHNDIQKQVGDHHEYHLEDV